MYLTKRFHIRSAKFPYSVFLNLLASIVIVMKHGSMWRPGAEFSAGPGFNYTSMECESSIDLLPEQRLLQGRELTKK
ncbi:MAG: hypothetical protein NVS4B8_29870 [Herpetosiphon sp.]